MLHTGARGRLSRLALDAIGCVLVIGGVLMLGASLQIGNSAIGSSASTGAQPAGAPPSVEPGVGDTGPIEPGVTDIGTVEPADIEAAPGAVAQRIRIPDAGIDARVVEGDGVTVPTDAVAHYPGTAWPGGGSNIYLYGHARTGLFKDLWKTRIGDAVELGLADGRQVRYRVEEIVPLARWDALEYLAPTAAEQLVLQTCLSYEPTSPRFIVIARPFSSGS